MSIPNQITKSSGQTESFDVEKLRRSLMHAGANDVLVNQVLQELAPQLQGEVSSRHIFKRAFKLLKRLHRPSAARYSLKQAMLDFGSTGFPFEDFVAELLSTQGYQVRTRQLLPGQCVQHEVDVVAQNDEMTIWVECKYHPMPDSVCNIKIPLYIHSRFRDMEAWCSAQPETDDRATQGWIMTNTRFSDDAMSYGRCAGLHLIGWNYPSGNSLREMINRSGVYPINCLTTLTQREKSILFEHSIVITHSVTKPGNWMDLLHISPERAQKVIQEATGMENGE